MLTDEYSKELGRVIESKEDVEEKMNKFNKIHDKIKFKAFGKVSIGKKSVKKHADDEDVQEDDKAKALYENQIKEANDAIEKIKKVENSKTRKNMGNKKTGGRGKEGLFRFNSNCPSNFRETGGNKDTNQRYFSGVLQEYLDK